MTKMLSRRSLSRKLIWCRDLIRRKFFTRKRYKYEELNEGRCFMQELPDEIIQLILQRLSLSDYLNLRHLSRWWRAAIDSKRWLPAAHLRLPRLVTSSNLGKCMQASYYIKTDDDLRIVSNPNILISSAPYCYCAGSIEGWLIITLKTRYSQRLFFWNPVSASGARVKLPFSRRRFSTTVKVVASSIPTSSTTKCCYVSCLHFKDKGRLAFCTPSDKSWTSIEKALKFWEIEIFDGKLYALGREALEYVTVFDIHLDTHAYTSQRLVTLHPNINSIYVDDTTYYRRCHLAKCCESNDLFMVLYENQSSNRIEGLFLVLKLEYNKVTTSHQWVEIDDLGDRTLFMGTVNNKFVTCYDKTLEKNCIYFVLSQGLEDYTSGVFSLTDRSFKRISLPEDHWRLYMNRSTWFTPIPC